MSLFTGEGAAQRLLPPLHLPLPHTDILSPFTFNIWVAVPTADTLASLNLVLWPWGPQARELRVGCRSSRPTQRERAGRQWQLGR